MWYLRETIRSYHPMNTEPSDADWWGQFKMTVNRILFYRREKTVSAICLLPGELEEEREVLQAWPSGEWGALSTWCCHGPGVLLMCLGLFLISSSPRHSPPPDTSPPPALLLITLRWPPSVLHSRRGTFRAEDIQHQKWPGLHSSDWYEGQGGKGKSEEGREIQLK